MMVVICKRGFLAGERSKLADGDGVSVGRPAATANRQQQGRRPSGPKKEWKGVFHKCCPCLFPDCGRE